MGAMPVGKQGGVSEPFYHWGHRGAQGKAGLSSDVGLRSRDDNERNMR
jgi:hypothetical protein